VVRAIWNKRVSSNVELVVAQVSSMC